MADINMELPEWAIQNKFKIFDANRSSHRAQATSPSQFLKYQIRNYNTNTPNRFIPNIIYLNGYTIHLNTIIGN